MTQRLRLISGLVLFTYVGTHLLNHALGVLSIGAVEAGRQWFIGLWRHPLGTVALYLSLTTHLALVLWAIFQRRHLRLPRWEIARLTLGLLIPIQLVPHVIGTRLQHELFGIDDNYTRQVLIYWVTSPSSGLLQIGLLLTAWTHGCIGVYSWLRARPGRRVALGTLRIIGLLLPLLALAGFADLGLALSERAADPSWLQAALQPLDPRQTAQLNAWRDGTLLALGGTVGLVFLARPIRQIWERQRRGAVCVSYPSGRRVLITPGTTVLEASRLAGIPHASVCGGRGRCSTCRVRVGAGLDDLPPAEAAEARVLRRVQAPAHVRLACQLRPTADLSVFPLFTAELRPREREAAPGQAAGREQEIAILFADLRDYTRFAERRYPYDVVFVLNEYFAAMGGAIERTGGRLDKFIGDGVMALYGLDSSAAIGCRQALAGAVAMVRALERLNQALDYDLREPLRIGIGLHVGPVIVGELGYGSVRSLTAIGDAVNTASRLETLTKELGCSIVVSDDTLRTAGVDPAGLPGREIQVRGRSAPLLIRMVVSASELEAILAE